MEKLFNYRPDGHTITTESGEEKIMVIRKGPRGIIAMVRGKGPIVIWDKDVADEHINDEESVLIAKVIEVLGE